MSVPLVDYEIPKNIERYLSILAKIFADENEKTLGGLEL
jgi:hypothetical protein